jgi:hypothetical protein
MSQAKWVATVMCSVMIVGLAKGADSGVKDLNPVKFKTAPSHPPVVLVENGQAKACIVMTSNVAPAAVKQLQSMIEKATGASLPITNKIEGAAVVIGDNEAAAKEGLVGDQMPIEGFAIKTASNRVFIVGNGDGLRWGICEFLERFVGVRWYFPEPDIGLSIPASPTLTVTPVWLEDAPFFRMRTIWPDCSESWHGGGTQLGPLHTFLRKGNSWSNNLVCHSPNWSTIAEYKTNYPNVFQLKSDQTRDYAMLCYGNPKTLELYLAQIEASLKGEKGVKMGISGKAVTVSPNDAEISCYCADCRKLWDDKGGTYGSASRILATFVTNLAREMQKRWPDMTVVYLPYLNYALAPKDFPAFPGNVEVQICGMPGMAMYKEPSVMMAEQVNVDAWMKLTGRKIQNWHYSCWPEDRTVAPFQYPHTVQQYYRQNRDKTVGTFINGVTDHWPRQNITLYCWMKCLWNPDYNVDAAIDTFCERMFGPAAKPMRELIQLQTDGWEKSRWEGGRLYAKGIFETSYPRATVEKMEALCRQALTAAQGDDLTTRRLEYYQKPFVAFFKASKEFAEGRGLKSLVAQKVGENPKIDGKLDDAVWARATPVEFVRAQNRTEPKPTYPTQARAVWTADGITFGFRMTEPTPDRLEKSNTGRDNPNAWWSDNVELLFDVTGKNEGEFYHFMVTANGDLFDARGKDISWNSSGVVHAVHVDKDFWSLEAFVPYAAFADAVKPNSGSQTSWYGNFTRHRVCDRGLKPPSDPLKDSVREYQRMNTTFANFSANLEDFAPIVFQE